MDIIGKLESFWFSLSIHFGSNCVRAGAMSGDRKLTKNEKRRIKKKENGSSGVVELNKLAKEVQKNGSSEVANVEYVSVSYENGDDPLVNEFKSVFEKFAKAEELLSTTVVSKDNKENSVNGSIEVDQSEVQETPKLSKKKRKLMSRLSAAELKQLVARPDVVEAHDVTSSDPRLLVYLKSYRNAVPVPRHWCAIRKYLQGKRGVEKIPFQLPEFIADTGIAKIRDSLLEQEAAKKGRAKQREKMRPKMGKIDIDYQVLHDAFFKYQTKPKMTGHGDLYYEGKEFEVNVKERRPGILSEELKVALGMQDGGPPPWLVNMQRYGLPPSYPNLRIPGLNAPLPPGAVFGFHPGGWGKPPTDEYGAPLYGDVFGIAAVDEAEAYAHIDKVSRWGALEPEEEVPEEEEDSEDEDDEKDAEELERQQQLQAQKQQGRASKRDMSGLETPSTLDGMMSSASSLDHASAAPGMIDLRKRAGLETPDTVYSGGQGGRELYTVIKEQQVTGLSGGGEMFGSDRTYVVPGSKDGATIHPDDLEDMMNSHQGSSATVSKSGKGGMTSEVDTGASKKRKAEPSAAVKRMKGFEF